MARVIRKAIKASELPKDWADELDAAPEEVVRVTLDARPRRDLRQLLQLADRASAEAKRRGLTKERLDELLDDA